MARSTNTGMRACYARGLHQRDAAAWTATCAVPFGARDQTQLSPLFKVSDSDRREVASCRMSVRFCRHFDFVLRARRDMSIGISSRRAISPSRWVLKPVVVVIARVVSKAPTFDPHYRPHDLASNRTRLIVDYTTL